MEYYQEELLNFYQKSQVVYQGRANRGRGGDTCTSIISQNNNITSFWMLHMNQVKKSTNYCYNLFLTFNIKVHKMDGKHSFQSSQTVGLSDILVTSVMTKKQWSIYI